MNDRVQQQTQRIYEKVALLALDLLARIIARRIDTGPPFSALLTLWLSMMAAVGLASRSPPLTALHIKRVMNAIERPVVAPQVEIVVHRAAWRQVFRDRPPLASRAQNIHYPIHHFAHIDVALVAAAPGRRDQRFNMRPFGVGQITRVSQCAAVVTSAVLRRPHR